MANEQVHPENAVAPPRPVEPATAESVGKESQPSEERAPEARAEQPGEEELRLLADTMPGDGPGDD